MKKTVNIHLAGILFVIEEDAYELVKSYLDRLRKSFEHSKDQEEICNDVEARMAELASAKKSDRKEVITIQDMEEILQTLGDPSDFIDEEENESQTKSNSFRTENNEERRFFRDTEKASFAGVCAGIAAYFQVDVVIVRVLFVLLGLVGGFMIPLYIILWMVTPAARTRIERLQMRGKAVTVDNIKEEFEHATDRIKQSSLRFEREIKDKNSHLRKSVGSVLQLIGKIVGIGFIGFGVFSLISVLFTSFIEIELFPFSSESNLLTFNEMSELIFIDDSNSFYMWFSSFSILICISLFSILLGITLTFRLKAAWMKPSFIFLVVFGIINLIVIAYQGVRLGADFTQTGIVEKERFSTNDSTLLIESFIQDDNLKLLKNKDYTVEFDIKENVIEFYQIDLDFQESKDSLFHVIATYKAQGNSIRKAKNRAKNIEHELVQKHKTLFLAPNYRFPKEDKLRNQRISYTVLIPKNKKLQIQNQIITSNNLDDEGYFRRNGVYEHDAADYE